MELSTNVHAGTTSTLVTTAVVVEPSVPSCCQVLATISLVNVHLHAVDAQWTAGVWTLTVTIVISIGVWVIWTDRVEIVVDAPF
jgi:hypothetical protein